MNEEIKLEEQEAAVAEEPKAPESAPEAPETVPPETAEPVEADVTPEPADEKEEPIGNIKISVDVVTTIAGIAASEIEGVSCMYTSFAAGVAQRLGAKKSTSKGVKVDMGEDSVSVDLYIIVEYGVKIPELAWNIQENVKSKIETMTGLDVSKVNIHIEGISFEKEEKAEEESVITE